MVPNIMNVLVFIPTGLLLGFLVRSIKWWAVMLIGVIISVSIELLQFCLKSGFSEFDDVMHNSTGCLLGYGVYCLAARGFRRVKRQNA